MHGLRGRSGGRVDAPEEHALSVVEVRRRHAGAIGILGSDATVPGAYVIGREQIRTAEGIGQALHPTVKVDGGTAGRSRARKNHALRAVVVFDILETQCGKTESLIPSHAYPSGIGIAFRSGTHHRVEQTIGRVHDLRRRGAFYADAAIGMIGVGMHSGELAVFDRRQHAAARRAHGAVGMEFFSGDG